MKDYVIDRSEFTPSSYYSHLNSFHMMKLCYAVYAGTTDNIGAKEDWALTERLVKGAGYEMRKFEDRSGIYEPNAMVCWDNDNVFLIFRGTEPLSWNQWATDANFFKTSFVCGEIHRGFKNNVELIWPQIMTCLREVYVGKGRRLFVAGHSLGAGMSQVACGKLEFEENLHPSAIYNYGCPRAYDFNGADLYNKRMGSRTFRVVNNNDVVTDIPLESMGFSHVGSFKYITSGGDLKDDPSWWYLMLDGAWGSVTDIFDLDLDAVQDHVPDEYTKRLANLAGK